MNTTDSNEQQGEPLEPDHDSVATIMAGTCAVGPLDCSVVEFLRGLKFFMDEESRGFRCDTHLLNLLRRAACVTWELQREWNTRPRSISAATGDEWLPIESAPRDGTPVLGYFGLTAGDEPPDMAVTRYDQKRGWISTEVPFQEFDKPTHWKPLPAAPSRAASASSPAAQPCAVSVTGKHRIDPPYCKDCGQTFASAASEGEQE